MCDSMPINDYIKDLLNIKDKDTVIDTEKITIKKAKYVYTKYIYGELTYTPDGCHVMFMLMKDLILLNM